MPSVLVEDCRAFDPVTLDHGLGRGWSIFRAFSGEKEKAVGTHTSRDHIPGGCMCPIFIGGNLAHQGPWPILGRQLLPRRFISEGVQLRVATRLKVVIGRHDGLPWNFHRTAAVSLS